MAKEGPIILIDDDEDDQETFADILEELSIRNKLRTFVKSTEAYEYLLETSEQPFIIFCDVNLPGQTGTEFKRKLDENPFLRKKSIPFVFYSTSVDQTTVNDAYTQMSVQGFFKKANSYNDIKEDLSVIFKYWSSCKHPNTR